MAFIMKEKNGLKYLQIPSFERFGFVSHGFSTRIGGISQGNLSSLNLGIKKNDKPEAVFENYKRFCNALNVDIDDLVLSDQIHGSSIHVATTEDRGKGITRHTDIHGVDALITRECKVALVTFFADCVPLFFLDTRTPSIAVAHAGWKGTMLKIAQKVVENMKKEFLSDPKDILVGVGPCIKQCCYEIDDLLAKEFMREFDFGDKLLKPSRPKHWMLDLVLANRWQLERVGVPSENISICEYCSSCNNNLFFSYRADCGRTGSLAAVIELKGQK